MEQAQLQNVMPNLLTQSMEVVERTSCTGSESNNWWESPFSTSQTVTTPSHDYQLTAPSTYNFVGISSTQSTAAPNSLYDSTTYPWPENRYTPFTAVCSTGVEATSQSYAVSQVSMNERGYNLSPQRIYSSPPPYPYSHFSNGVPVSAQNNYYPSSDPASSPVESPVSSPESLDFFQSPEKPVLTAIPRVDQMCLPPPSLDLPKFSITNNFGNYPATTAQPAQVDSNRLSRKQVRMPQRKGGIQLWQFLYALLSDKSHSNLIEWTSNRASNEFRMLEPESIAVWWGTIKSKPTMTYDKFSRSLRYYYHKGILKKIQGERYMYRFLVDPEDMYRHIGTSNKRPELKNMPKEAKLVMGIFAKQRVETAIERSPIVTKPPEVSSPAKTLKSEVKMDKLSLVDFNNSNNSFVDCRLPLMQSPQMPILIPAAAW